MRRRLSRAQILCLSVALSVPLLEVVLRVGAGRDVRLQRMLYMPGVGTQYERANSLTELMAMTPAAGIPNTRHGDFILNSRGFKTTEYTYAKPDDVFRVVVLGDSFTYASGGVPYDSLWHVQLGQRLGQQQGRDVEVLSLGVAAVGPDFYLRMWQLEGSLLDADLVVLEVAVGNDFTDMGDDLEHVSILDRAARASFVVRLVRNWHIRSTGIESEDIETDSADARPRRGGGRVQDGKYTYRPDTPVLTAERFEMLNRGVVRRLFTPAQHENLVQAFARVRERLAELNDLVTSSGTPMVMVLIPQELQVNSEMLAALTQGGEGSAADLDLDAANRLAVEWCAQEGIPCLDLLPVSRELGSERKLYRFQDVHWNVEGNTMAADELSRFLREQGLVE